MTSNREATMNPDLLQATLDALDVGIALVGPERRIRYCNAAYANLFAVPPELLLGASFFGAGSPCDGFTARGAEWDRGETISVTGESLDGSPVDVIVRPLATGSDMRLVLARRGLARSLRGGTLPAEVLADVRTYLEELTGHATDDDALARAPLSILVLAVEGLDGVRRNGGDPAAGEVVRQVAQILVLEKRKSDVITRYGEGVFLVLAPDTPGPQAALLADRFRDRVEEIQTGTGAVPSRVRLRASTAEYRPHLDGPLREAVDRAAAVLRRSAPADAVATTSAKFDVDTTATDR